MRKYMQRKEEDVNTTHKTYVLLFITKYDNHIFKNILSGAQQRPQENLIYCELSS